MEINTSYSRSQTRFNFAWHGWLGFGLIAVFWPINWLLPGMRTAWGFFPLWLGYCLVIDAVVFKRTGTSLAVRSWKRYVALFLVSMPGWWLFELLNYRVQNWYYTGTEYFTPLQFFLLASLNFSVVIPAVFGTAELASTFGFIRRMKSWLVIRSDRKTTLTFFFAGCAMLVSMLVWPQYCFPFMWLSVYFILEPMNAWLSNRSLAQFTRHGDWRPVVSLFIGVLITGFFWEMWNYFSFPKWIYTVPFVGSPKIFEMPLLGYGGYLPFALELFALYHFILGLLGQKRDRYVLPDF